MNAQLESLGRLRVQGVLLLAAVFLIGALAGAAFERARRARPAPPPHPRGQGFLPGLRDELGLTEEQDRRIHEILEGNRPRADSLMNRFLPRLRALTDSIRQEVRGELTPEQQKIFDARQPRLTPPPGVPLPGEGRGPMVPGPPPRRPRRP